MRDEDQHIDLGDEEPFDFTYQVPLTMSDKVDRTDALCQLRDTREREDGILTSAKSIHKDRIAQIEIRESEIFRELRTEQRDVTGLCILRKNYEAGTVETVLVEEGTVVAERPMSDDERQMGLAEASTQEGDSPEE
jgi:hypothetical protein